MNKRVLMLLLPLLSLLVAASPAPRGGELAHGTRLAVIVSAQSTLYELSEAELRRIFLGEISEHEGTRFVPLNYGPSDPLRVAFDRLALGFSPDTAGRYWVDRRIRGQGLPPRAITSQTLLRNVVARLPGGIGYVTTDQLDPTVRALKVEGASHEQPNYPLTVR